MRVIYHPETESVEVPVEFIERVDRSVARIQVLALILHFLIEELKVEEQRRRWRLLWSAN